MAVPFDERCYTCDGDGFQGFTPERCQSCGGSGRRPVETRVATRPDWVDEIEAQIDSTCPYYLPMLIAEIRRLRKLVIQRAA